MYFQILLDLYSASPFLQNIYFKYPLKIYMDLTSFPGASYVVKLCTLTLFKYMILANPLKFVYF